MWKYLRSIKEPKLINNPVLLVSLSTSIPQYQLLYSQGRELGIFLLDRVNFKHIATLYSSAMPPAVNVSQDGIAELAGVHFYHYMGERDVVLLAGFSSPTNEEYEFSQEVLNYAQRLGIKEVISIGARWNQEPTPPTEAPKVLGFSTDEAGVKWLERCGIEILKDEPAFYFANLIVAMAPLYGIRGYKISVNHGEPKPHPKSLISILDFLCNIGIKIETGELEARAKQLAEKIQKEGAPVVLKAPQDLEYEEGEEEEEFGEGPPEDKDIYR